jgi:hypothetical protein
VVVATYSHSLKVTVQVGSCTVLPAPEARALVQMRGRRPMREEMQWLVPIEDLFKGRHFDRQYQ